MAGYGSGSALIRAGEPRLPRRLRHRLPRGAGEFVALCPADDIWEPAKLQWQQDALGGPSGGGRRLRRGAEVRPGERRPPPPGSHGHLLDGRWFAPRDVSAEPDRGSERRGPPVALSRPRRLRAAGGRGLRVLDARARRRARPSISIRGWWSACASTAANLSYRALDIWETNHLIHSRYADLAGDPELVRRTLAHDLLMIGYCRAVMGRSRDARRSFRASLATRLSPLSLAAAVAMSVPGVARAISVAAPRVRRATSGATSP